MNTVFEKMINADSENNFDRQDRCRKEFIDLAEKFNLELLSEYTRRDTPVKVRCKKCGRVFNIGLRSLRGYDNRNEPPCKCIHCSNIYEWDKETLTRRCISEIKFDSELEFLKAYYEATNNS